MNTPSPEVSYVVLAYGQGEYIGDSVKTALSQEHDSMEFIFSDDCSEDDTYDRMKAAVARHARPGQRITVVRNQRNLGLGPHLAEAIGRARGQIIVFQAGDDLATPGRTARIASEFRSYPDVMMVMHNVRVVDASGRTRRARYLASPPDFTGPLGELVSRGFPGLVGASEAIRREVFDRFGRFAYRDCYEDYAFAFRAALLGRISYLDEVLIDWRHHGSNMSHFVDFASADAAAKFRGHFLRNLKAHITFLRQHLVDLDRCAQSASSGAVHAAVRAKLARHRLELAARSAAPWRLVALTARHAFRHGATALWVGRQLVIRALHQAYFWAVARNVRNSLNQP
jgi:GT2 family glycosyltransferase